jgi:hypothetical protein
MRHELALRGSSRQKGAQATFGGRPTVRVAISATLQSHRPYTRFLNVGSKITEGSNGFRHENFQVSFLT